jgi:hypothetical protein
MYNTLPGMRFHAMNYHMTYVGKYMYIYTYIEGRVALSV